MTVHETLNGIRPFCERCVDAVVRAVALGVRIRRDAGTVWLGIGAGWVGRA